MPMYSNESTAGPRPQFDMDREAEDRFCRFVDRMPAKTDGMIRLFDRGDYYSAHGSDAIFVAHEVFHTTNVIKYLGSGINRPSTSTSAITAKGLPSVTMNMNQTKKFLRQALTTRQMRVEIYDPEEGAAGRKNNTQWRLGKAASPGNLAAVEDLLFDHSDMLSNAVSMAVRVHTKEGLRTVGCAFVDVQEKMIGVTEYAEDDIFSNTESLLIQLGVKECLIQADDKKADHDLSKLKTLIERCGIIITERKAADFQVKNVEQDLNRLLSENSAGTTLPEFELKTAMSSLAAILIYLNLLSDESLLGQLRLHRHDLSQYMKLDASAVKALNLMPGPTELGGNKNMSLYGLLNHCETSQGKRLLGRWLKQPLVNLHEIAQRQGIVEGFYDDSINRRSLQTNFLKYMPDFHRLAKKFHRRVANLEDVIRVFQAIQRLDTGITLVEAINTTHPANKALIEEKYLAPLKDHAEKLSPYTLMVEETIDLNELDNHNYVLKASIDNNLQDLRSAIDEVREQFDEEHRSVADDLGVDMDKKLHLEKHQVHGYSFRITKAEAGLLRNKKQYIDLGTQKSGSLFTTKTLKELKSNFEQLQNDYEKEQRSLVKEVVDIASTYVPVLELLDSLVAAIDVTVSFAHVASASSSYVRPTLKEKGTGDIIVRGARHPCLEVQDDVTFVANDHEMRKGSGEFIVLTGPNMGGKSTYIRQIGVIALMAQIGCFVPADEAELPVFDCILARVGAGDSQLKGMSTFMAEMLETATILKSATKDSLIIIDELGRGTSTYDGFGLAWAISEHIATEIRCFCLFATHFHELTILDQSIPHVKNLNVMASVTPRQPAENGGVVSKQDNEIVLLYKINEGVCDQSFGIHVAELANFPESVIKLAKRKAEELEDFSDGTGTADLPISKFSKNEVDAGTNLIKSFLDEWKSRVDTAEAENGQAPSEEEQVEELKRVAGDFAERFDDNPWVTNLLASL